MRVVFLFSILILMALISCKQGNEPVVDALGLNYFPLTKGDYRVYDVEEINYNLDGSIDTSTFQLREEIGEELPWQDGKAYRLENYMKVSEMSPWVADSVWSVRRNNYHLVVVENNVPVIILSFPVNEGKKWDGNALNTKESDEFFMENVGMPYLSGNQDYPKTLTMYREDFLDPIQITRDNYHMQVFADRIGMIYRIDKDIQYCDPTQCNDQGIIEYGRVVEYTLNEYMVE